MPTLGDREQQCQDGRQHIQRDRNARTKPEIVNTDQGAQFTSQAFTGLLKEQDIQIRMDDKGAWRACRVLRPYT